MRLIISPAKKMNVVDAGINWDGLPSFIAQADALAKAVRALSFEEAKALWRCSDALARLNYGRFQSMDLRDEARLTPAVLAYEGIQYQHLAAQVMDERHIAWLQEHLRILSGLYGMLKPLDGIVPYRLEMQAKLSAEGRANLYEYWADGIYRALADETDAIVNLASAEYAKTVVPYARKDDRLRLVTCAFGTLDADGTLRQRATAVKAARGSMVRWCAENGVEDVEDLKEFDVLDHRFAPERSDESTYVFVKRP